MASTASPPVGAGRRSSRLLTRPANGQGGHGAASPRASVRAEGRRRGLGVHEQREISTAAAATGAPSASRTTARMAPGAPQRRVSRRRSAGNAEGTEALVCLRRCSRFDLDVELGSRRQMERPDLALDESGRLRRVHALERGARVEHGQRPTERVAAPERQPDATGARRSVWTDHVHSHFARCLFLGCSRARRAGPWPRSGADVDGLRHDLGIVRARRCGPNRSLDPPGRLQSQPPFAGWTRSIVVRAVILRRPVRLARDPHPRRPFESVDADEPVRSGRACPQWRRLLRDRYRVAHAQLDDCIRHRLAAPVDGPDQEARVMCERLAAGLVVLGHSGCG